MDIVLTCPLGSVCEEIKDNKQHRCRWYQNVKGKDPQSEALIDRWDCALVWQNVIGVEIAQTNRSNAVAIESLRNEMITRQDIFNGLISEALTKRKTLE